MKMEDVILLIVISVIAVAIVLLKLFHLNYCKEERCDTQVAGDIIGAMPPYKAYERISQKSSPSNRPKREEGDFFDYVFSDSKEDSSNIENQLLHVYGEDLSGEDTSEK